MQISPISFRAQSFQARQPQQPQPIVDIEGDDEVVMYSTWGDNYAFPITAGQLRRAQEAVNNPSVDKKNIDKDAAYSTWGGNYAYPVTSGQLKPAQEEVDKPSIDKNINQEVAYSTWGDNYAYPVTTEQTRYQQRAKNIIEEHEKPHIVNICEYDKINGHPLEGCDETPEKY